MYNFVNSLYRIFIKRIVIILYFGVKNSLLDYFSIGLGRK